MAKLLFNIVRGARTVKHARKFTRLGKHCRFPGKYLDVQGHVELGDNCRFRDNVTLQAKPGGRIIFGTYSGCSYYCRIVASHYVQIGRFTGIAEFTMVTDTGTNVMGSEDAWCETPPVILPVVIGDSCMIASRCYIGPGVAIGDGAVLAPGTVVTRDVGPYEVWAGNPARKIAHRTKNVPRMMQERYRALLETVGLKKARRGYDDQDVRVAAADGKNRSAEQRDKILKEMGIQQPRL